MVFDSAARHFDRVRSEAGGGEGGGGEGGRPHVIITNLEHDSVSLTVQKMEEQGKIGVSEGLYNVMYVCAYNDLLVVYSPVVGLCMRLCYIKDDGPHTEHVLTECNCTCEVLLVNRGKVPTLRSAPPSLPPSLPLSHTQRPQY